MECSCDIDFNITSIPNLKFYSKIDVIAIIDHVCNECKRVIKQDEAYELVHGNWSGFINTYHTCSDCLNLRNIFYPYGFYLGELWQVFKDELNNWDYQIPEDCMVKLSKRNFNKICEEIEKGWEFLDMLKEDGKDWV